MNNSKQLPLFGIAAAAIVVLAIGVGVVACLWSRPYGEQGSGLTDEYDYTLDKWQKIDPALVQYRQTKELPVGMRDVRAVAVGPKDQIYVAGDKAVGIFAPDGGKLKEIALTLEPYCLAVADGEHQSPGRMYVGMKDHVEVFDAEGTREAAWDRPPGKQTVLTSIAVAAEDVFVADAGAKLVWHYDLHGKLLGSIGKTDPDRGVRGFVVPSPYFDVAVAPDGLLRVANSGAHRIEAYTFDGHQELFWGKAGMGIENFCGCCNPSNFAIMADGRVVTAEKGIPRVKVYSADGTFECVVVGPDVLAPNRSATVETRDDLRLHPVDLAVDSRDRILVLDPAARCVRVFEHK